jgi:hypothetical protein
MPRVTITLSEELYDFIKSVSYLEDRTISKQIAFYIKEIMDANTKRIHKMHPNIVKFYGDMANKLGISYTECLIKNLIDEYNERKGAIANGKSNIGNE